MDYSRFRPDWKVLATHANDGRIQLWDVGRRRYLPTLRRKTGIIWGGAGAGIEWSPDGSKLAFTDGDVGPRLGVVRGCLEAGWDSDRYGIGVKCHLEQPRPNPERGHGSKSNESGHGVGRVPDRSRLVARQAQGQEPEERIPAHPR